MTNFLNHVFLLDGTSWLSDGLSEDGLNSDSPIVDEDVSAPANNIDLKSQPVIGILPIRNTVAYPGTIIPLTVGRAESKALLADAERNDAMIGLVTQRKAEVDKPGFDDLHPVGTTASVLKTIKMPQGSINIFVHGIARFQIVERVATEPYLKAKVKLLSIKTPMTKQLQALIVMSGNWWAP